MEYKTDNKPKKTINEIRLQGARILRGLAAKGGLNGEMKKASKLITALEKKGCLTDEFYKRDNNDVFRFRASYGNEGANDVQSSLLLAAVALESIANRKEEGKGLEIPVNTHSPFYTRMLDC